MNIFQQEADAERYIIVEYFLQSKTTLREASWNLAIGQSIGNPNLRSPWESTELFEKHACQVLEDEGVLESRKAGTVHIAFPVANINFEEDGMTQLLVQIMGGQLDIDIIEKCQIRNVRLPRAVTQLFPKPKYGITGVRRFTGVYGKPLLGGILKPKIGVDSYTVVEIVKQLVQGGVNFIKEDEILSNPAHCPLRERLPLVMEYLKGKNVIYAANITSDYPHVVERARIVHECGGNAVHINFWNGLGVYKAVRRLNLPLFLFFQRSGDKILTASDHAYHIERKVLTCLASLMGIDFIHAGMWGGYMSEDETSLRERLQLLRRQNVMPSLSCGMHPGLLAAINKRFGVDYMANCGGAIHGHPGGTVSGARAMRQAIDGERGVELDTAIEKWGMVE